MFFIPLFRALNLIITLYELILFFEEGWSIQSCNWRYNVYCVQINAEWICPCTHLKLPHKVFLFWWKNKVCINTYTSKSKRSSLLNDFFITSWISNFQTFLWTTSTLFSTIWRPTSGGSTRRPHLPSEYQRIKHNDPNCNSCFGIIIKTFKCFLH